ncbi:unnamed protein product [Closterium sp. Naga37s-1]|nr:unnamed protein product [Closterium sp. Naga37s-1]
MESMTHGGPVKGGTAAALQSAADKNVQAGVVPPMQHEKAAARAEATGAGAGAGARGMGGTGSGAAAGKPQTRGE